MAGYTELQACSNYSFLRGASRIEELMFQAKALGYDALAITDQNSLAGIARAHARATEVGIRLVVGCRLELSDGLPVLAYPLDRAGYARLCRLLTLGKSRGGKGTFDISWADLAAAREGLLVDFHAELTRVFHRELTPVNLWFAVHAEVKFLPFSFRPFEAAALALKRKLSLPVSTMWQ